MKWRLDKKVENPHQVEWNFLQKGRTKNPLNALVMHGGRAYNGISIGCLFNIWYHVFEDNQRYSVHKEANRYH